MRGKSYTPSPPRGYGRRGRSPSPRGRYGGRGRDMPTSLLVRNLRHDCRQEDLRRHFGQFGALKDTYLPRDYYTGEPRGFGFVQYVDPGDAAEAKYHMDGYVLLGRELTVVFAEENRKKPSDMRMRERVSKGRFHDRRRSPPYIHVLLAPLDRHHLAAQDLAPVVLDIVLLQKEGIPGPLHHRRRSISGIGRGPTLRDQAARGQSLAPHLPMVRGAAAGVQLGEGTGA